MITFYFQVLWASEDSVFDLHRIASLRSPAEQPARCACELAPIAHAATHAAP